MSTKLQVNELAATESDTIFIVRNIIGDTAFIERLADGQGNILTHPFATSCDLKKLRSPIQSIKATIEHYQKIIINLMNILDKYAPSNEGDEQET